MFRNRKNSQKPAEGLYAEFRNNFPQICTESSPSFSDDQQKADVLAGTLLGTSLPQRSEMDGNDGKPSDALPKVSPEWGFTPSLMDPNSLDFTTFANQPPAYYTTTPGTTGILSHPQAGDLPTPSMAINLLTPRNLLTPLAIPQNTSAGPGTISQSAVEMGSYNHQFIPPAASQQNGDPFGQPHTFAPSTLFRRDPDLPILDRSFDDSTFGMSMGNPSLSLAPNPALGGNIDGLNGHSNENFRFCAILRASTAMVKDPDEIPVTYLNKGQAYTISIADTAPLTTVSPHLRYRTYIRVSFEEEEQRSKPAACWQLWKEGRGTNEAHQRDGKLLAVEHVDPNQGGDETRHPRVQLEKAQFDGFSVIWSPNRTTGNPECQVSVRFNFLSTDFSHSKGVKGIPVRLCAKTEVLATGNPDPPLDDAPEVCYCKVKLFRDHGAERKLSNDVAHVKKLMDKLRQQIAQAEVGSANFDKRKRSCSISAKGGAAKAAKIGKHKRPWSVSDGAKSSLEDDLQMKLASLNEMFSSTQTTSMLNLKGDPQDDPDLYPVQLDMSMEDGLPRHNGIDSTNQSVDGASVVSRSFSPSISNHSPVSHHSFDAKHANFSNNSAYPASRHGSLDWSSISQRDSDEHAFIKREEFSTPVKIQRVTDSSNGTNTFIEALGVDNNYIPPEETPKQPKCCFYVQVRQTVGQKSEDYHHAIYLTERTADSLVGTIAKKCRFDPARITRALCIRPNGVNVVLDDDVVNELPEGQAMAVEFSETNQSDDTDMDIDSPRSPTGLTGIEMRLIF